MNEARPTPATATTAPDASWRFEHLDPRARWGMRLNALLLTCGIYDSVGSFAYRVGLPAKSGVGGGIVAVIPGKATVAVWSPELDRFGTSVVGTAALEAFSQITNCSVL